MRGRAWPVEGTKIAGRAWRVCGVKQPLEGTPAVRTRVAAVMCDVAWHDVGSRWSCWVRRGRTWCIWCAGIGAERRQMGVQRIPLRLPRAAPVPLRPGSCSSSSSISPCIPSSLPPSLYPSLTHLIPCLTSPDRASLLRLRNQARRSRRAPSILALAPTLQHRLNHLSFLLA